MTVIMTYPPENMHTNTSTTDLWLEAVPSGNGGFSMPVLGCGCARGEREGCGGW